MLKKMEITMHFHEVILQMPSYAKFLKDILTKKRVVEKETIALSTKISAAITKHELPPKMSDPGSFSIPCKLGNIEIDGTLCDLGASVSLMPLSIYKKLNIGDLKPTRMALQLADRSIKYPAGILEDVPLKIGGFYVPVDFVVLDMDEDSKVPIIVGRPFLSTADVVVHVRSAMAEEVIGEFREVDPLEVSLMATEASLYSNWEEIEEISRALDGQETEKEASELFQATRPCVPETEELHFEALLATTQAMSDAPQAPRGDTHVDWDPKHAPQVELKLYLKG
ncbi:PREDICTED: uncharacterized protein LOC104811348 [Tarenaya hassleriana]|uniref:uncharacterized protein LOC104811348 n=1 Tax=Tarenaya hassleriana TaxID=28532 RepID=UPI00053C9F4E|nr:PREDICTED: uncharacterized protein LOC104811348 [Tarenaya hassleriana]